jgi:hypothetical protein
VLGHIAIGGDIIVGVANGEPKTVVDAIEAGADRVEGSACQRTRHPIDVADPEFREDLHAAAHDCGYVT